jgi:type IV pilus assembly protein PilY1
MAINPFTGGRLPQTFFDANRDGVIDARDTDGGASPSGLGLDSGLNETISIGSVLEINTDEGVTKNIMTQGSSADPARMSWREVVN